jgi:hypothetical protein
MSNIDVVVRRGEDSLEFFGSADYVKVEKRIKLLKGEPVGDEHFVVELRWDEEESRVYITPKRQEVVDIYGGGTRLLARVTEKKATWMARS